DESLSVDSLKLASRRLGELEGSSLMEVSVITYLYLSACHIYLGQYESSRTYMKTGCDITLRMIRYGYEEALENRRSYSPEGQAMLKEVGKQLKGLEKGVEEVLSLYKEQDY